MAKQNKDDGQELDKIQFSTGLADMERLTPFLADYQKQVSPMLFNYYTELIMAGFNKEQALKIVCVHGVMPKIVTGAED